MASSSSSSSYIPLHKTQLPPRMHHHPFSPLSNPQKSHHHHHKHLLLIITLSLLPFLLYLLSLYRSLHLPPSSSFGIVIDISLSRSQILVFRSLNEVSGNPFSGQSSESLRIKSGISEFSRNPEGVGPVILKLVEFAKEKVPNIEWEDTKVQVMIVGDEIEVEERTRVVFDECRRVLQSSGFLFRDHWASVLKSQDKDLYSWLAVNYALGYLGNKPKKTAGVVSLGRSALQVTFASSETPLSESSRVIRLAGVPYNLYTQSLQKFGQDAVWKLLDDRTQDLMTSSVNSKRSMPNPCYPRGYKLASLASDEKYVKSHATGNFSACKSELTVLLKDRKGKCERAPCEIVPSIFSELENKPHPQQRFFLFSQFRGLVPKASISKMEFIAQHFCEDDWEKQKQRYDDIDDLDLSRLCFSHAFMAILLQNSFGIPFDEKRIEFAAGSTRVDWRLGAFISQTIMEPVDNITEHHDAHIVENESVTFFFVFAVLIIFVLLATFFVMKLRKPQFKTIYDLEKGRYIVTRVPR